MKRSTIITITKFIIAVLIIGLIVFLILDIEDKEELRDTVGLLFFGIIGLAVFICTKRNQGKFNNYKLNFGTNGKYVPNIEEIDYYRDIPCNNDILKAYWVIYQYELTSAVDCYKGLIGAILLEWLQKNYITIKETKNGIFNMQNNNYAIDLSNVPDTNLNEIEFELLEYFKEASNNNILESKEFKTWTEEHTYRFNSWFENVIKFETKKLEQEGLIESSKLKKHVFLLGSMEYTVKNVKEDLRQEAINILGLKKFLLDYSIIRERETKEIILWSEYLIFAQLLGIADKIDKQLNKIYPDFSHFFTPSAVTVSLLNKLCKELEFE